MIASAVSTALRLQLVTRDELAGHVVAPPAVIGQRLRDRVAAGDTAMQRLLDQHERGLMRPEIFAPSPLAAALVTIDTSVDLPLSDHTAAVLDAFHRLQDVGAEIATALPTSGTTDGARR